jgi:hypothetical protein
VLTVLLVSALLLSAMAAGFHQFVMPLDVAGYGLLRRLGL